MSLFGLPSLPKLAGGKAILNTILSRVQSTLWRILGLEPVWGIYEAGSSVVMAFQPDSVIEMSVSEESHIPDYRVQTGGFATYNKIAQPFEIPIRITKHGDSSERDTLIEFLKKAVKDVKTYDILMPECVWSNVTLTRYQIDRSREKTGHDLIIADCWFKEVREAPTVYYNPEQDKADTTNTGDPDAVPTTPEKQSDPTLSKITDVVQGVFQTTNRKTTTADSSNAANVKKLTDNVSNSVKKYLI